MYATSQQVSYRRLDITQYCLTRMYSQEPASKKNGAHFTDYLKTAYVDAGLQKAKLLCRLNSISLLRDFNARLKATICFLKIKLTLIFLTVVLVILSIGNSKDA